MPSGALEGGAPDIVLGDRFGSSASPWVVDVAEEALRARGLGVRRNKPYAGGYITEYYGSPARGRHALQIEVNRALYMDERKLLKLEKAEALADALLYMSRALAARAHGLAGVRQAAE
jgi:N-formylglutamate amidohydrolase